MTEVDDPVRRLLERISDGSVRAYRDTGAVSANVARKWLALPEQLQRAQDAMRWRKASATMPEGRYAFAMIGQRGSESVLVGHGIVVYGTGGQDAITDLPSQARFLGPLPEVPR